MAIPTITNPANQNPNKHWNEWEYTVSVPGTPTEENPDPDPILSEKQVIIDDTLPFESVLEGAETLVSGSERVIDSWAIQSVAVDTTYSPSPIIDTLEGENREWQGRAIGTDSVSHAQDLIDQTEDFITHNIAGVIYVDAVELVFSAESTKFVKCGLWCRVSEEKITNLFININVRPSLNTQIIPIKFMIPQLSDTNLQFNFICPAGTPAFDVSANIHYHLPGDF